MTHLKKKKREENIGVPYFCPVSVSRPVMMDEAFLVFSHYCFWWGIFPLPVFVPCRTLRWIDQFMRTLNWISCDWCHTFESICFLFLQETFVPMRWFATFWHFCVVSIENNTQLTHKTCYWKKKCPRLLPFQYPLQEWQFNQFSKISWIWYCTDLS